MSRQVTDQPRAEDFAAPARMDAWLRRALLAGLVASAACLAGAFLDSAQFFRSYLVAYLYIVAFPLGCLALAMLNHVTKGAWGVILRRIFEAAARTMPLMALLFVPIALGMKDLFVWTDPEIVSHDQILQGKTPYLNVPFFLIRAGAFFALWWALGAFLSRLSRRQDETGDPALAMRMQAVSSVGLAIFVITASFASFDWLMSLDPHWFSSIYGIHFIGGQALSALAFAVVVGMFLSRREPMAGVIRASHFHDYGKLLLAFLMLWAYFSVSQLIIIWSGNLPEEAPWYLERTSGGWQLVTQALVLLHFFVPFLLLLNARLKRSAGRLALVAGLLLVMRWVDGYWQAAPAMHVHRLHWMDVVLTIGLGGLWLAFFFWQLRRRPLLPVKEPFLSEALSHG